MSETTRTVRGLAVAAAAGAALVYGLIGAGVLSIGTAADGSTPDPFAFGAIVGGVHAVVAVLLLRIRSVVFLALVGALEVVVLAGYVAMAGLREPPFEAWGLLIKACQLTVLGCVGYLAIRGREATGTAGAA